MSAIKSKKIGILAGGPSSEREISLASGKAVHNALSELGYDVVFIDVESDDMQNLKISLSRNSVDFAFIALHGRFGEDGTIQKFLESLKIPYTGSGPESSKAAMDKIASKEVFARCNISNPPYKVFKKGDKLEIDNVEVPIVVKPQHEGSSIGLSIVKELKDLDAAIQKALKYGDNAILEKYIKGREITVGILDETPLCAIEIVPGSEFYDYQAKYIRPDTKYLIPAPIKKSESDEAMRLALLAHKALGCRGFSRVDMMLDESSNIYILEVNTIPGLTTRSLLPKSAQYVGLSFNDLCIKMIDMALK